MWASRGHHEAITWISRVHHAGIHTARTWWYVRVFVCVHVAHHVMVHTWCTLVRTRGTSRDGAHVVHACGSTLHARDSARVAKTWRMLAGSHLHTLCAHHPHDRTPIHAYSLFILILVLIRLSMICKHERICSLFSTQTQLSAATCTSPNRHMHSPKPPRAQPQTAMCIVPNCHVYSPKPPRAQPQTATSNDRPRVTIHVPIQTATCTAASVN